MHLAGAAIAGQFAGIAAEHVPFAAQLLTHVEVKVLREAKDEAKDVIGNDIAEDAAHVGHDHGRLHQFGV